MSRAALLSGSVAAHERGRLQVAWIVGPWSDAVFFLGLPFLAAAAAFAGHMFLSAVAVASIALWIDVPHQSVTLIRTFGVAKDRRQFRNQLIIGLILISAVIATGLTWAPLSLLLLSTLWNHQHQLMQLHGFARIYDFKASAADVSGGRWDLTLAWVLYGNLFVSSPLFTTYWLRECHRLGAPLSAFDVHTVHFFSWLTTGLFLIGYVIAVARRYQSGIPLNPVKYLFIVSNYAVLYFVCWHTLSVFVYGIANIMMHGVQYIVFVHVYLQRSTAGPNSSGGFIRWLVRPRHLPFFIGLLMIYVILYQLMSGRPLDELGFGAIQLASHYEAVPEVQLRAMSALTGQEIWLLTLLNVPGLLHLYYDSFIWKVREKKTQGGL